STSIPDHGVSLRRLRVAAPAGDFEGPPEGRLPATSESTLATTSAQTSGRCEVWSHRGLQRPREAPRRRPCSSSRRAARPRRAGDRPGYRLPLLSGLATGCCVPGAQLKTGSRAALTSLGRDTGVVCGACLSVSAGSARILSIAATDASSVSF